MKHWSHLLGEGRTYESAQSFHRHSKGSPRQGLPKVLFYVFIVNLHLNVAVSIWDKKTLASEMWILAGWMKVVHKLGQSIIGIQKSGKARVCRYGVIPCPDTNESARTPQICVQCIIFA